MHVALLQLRLQYGLKHADHDMTHCVKLALLLTLITNALQLTLCNTGKLMQNPYEIYKPDREYNKVL